MRSKTVLFFFLISIVALCDASQSLEARGKKKNNHLNGLWIYFADIIIKKIFVLKLVYAFVLWCVVHKAGYFLGWFVSYLKEKKEDHHEHHHVDHHDYDPGYSSYGPYRKSYKTR